VRAYSVYDRHVGPREGACLVFANTAREAKKIGWRIISYWGADSFIDTGVSFLKDRTDFLQSLKEKETPHAIESPPVCIRCETWGGVLKEGDICEDCRDEEKED